MTRRRIGKRLPLDEQLRRAIRQSGWTRYRVAKEAKLSLINLTRFLRGQDVKLTTAARIAAVLGLELRPRQHD
jgi:transcriptional regulator with XRE-family HTH domain